MRMISPYISERDGVLYVADTGVSVVGIVAGWKHGRSAEEIAHAYPAVTREQIEGVLVYFREHPDEAERILREYDELFERRRAEAYASDPAFYDSVRRRFEAARQARRDASDRDDTGTAHGDAQRVGDGCGRPAKGARGDRVCWQTTTSTTTS